jgi:hypothetical protein
MTSRKWTYFIPSLPTSKNKTGSLNGEPVIFMIREVDISASPTY